MRHIYRTFFVVLSIALFAGVVPVNALEIKKVVSPGGLTAWLVQDKSVPVISVSFAFRGGATTDPIGKEGRADMVSALLDEGAGGLKSQEFQHALEDISATIGFHAGLDRFGGRMRTLSVNRDKAFDLLRLALTTPRFDPEPVERIRTQILVSLKQQSENPQRIAGRMWFRTVFKEHPYGRPVAGTEKSVAAITIDDLRAFVNTHIARNSLIVGVSGDISAAELGRRMDEVFGGIAKKSPQGSVGEATIAGLGRTIVVRKPIPQSVVIFGQSGIKRSDPDYYAAYVMTQILGGGGFRSRLTEQVREKRGLAYSVYSYLNPLDHAGLILGGLGTQNAKVAKSIEIVRSEWHRLATEGVTDKELAETKTYLNGSFPLRFDSSRRIARILVAVQFSKLGIDYLKKRADLINAVTQSDIRRVSRRLLNSDQLTVVVVGDPQGVKSTN